MKIDRKAAFKILWLGIWLQSAWTVLPAAGPLLLLSRGEAAAIREAISRREPAVAAITSRLRTAAAECRRQGPWSVTSKRPKDVDIGPNDFYSEGPYWWPDPKNPAGPYVRRDGERYPGRFTGNDDDLKSMGLAVMTLGLSAYFLGDADAAGHADAILKTWFLDPKTRMNPHLEYGQAIKGLSTGRGIGIIDSVPLVWAVQGMLLLEESGHWKGEAPGAVRRWYSEYLRWLTTSQKGLDEKSQKNNHGTWWTVQAAAYALFVQDIPTQKMAWNRYREVLVPGQMRPDGSCPLEEERTRSLSYSTMNLNGFSLICRMAQVAGENLWDFRTPDGAGLSASAAYLKPFVERPTLWKKPQITEYEREGVYFLAYTGLAVRSQDYLQLFLRTSSVNPEPTILLPTLLVIHSKGN